MLTPTSKYTYRLGSDNNFQPFIPGAYQYTKEIFKGFIRADGLCNNTLKLPGAYIMYFPKTEEVYIGSSHCPRKRYVKHLYALNRNIHDNKGFQNTFDTCNKEVELYVHPFTTREEAYEKEQSLLNEYKSHENVLNMAPNVKNQTGFKHSEETKRKMSELRQTPEMRELSRQNATGYKHSDEQKAKISAGLKGRPISEKNKQITSALFKGVPRTEEVKANMQEAAAKRFPKISIDGVIYKNALAASKHLGIGSSTVDYRLKNDNFPNWFRLPLDSDIPLTVFNI